MSLDNIAIGKKLISGFIAVVIITIIVGLYARSVQNTTKSAQDELATIFLPSAVSILEMQSALLDLNTKERALLLRRLVGAEREAQYLQSDECWKSFDAARAVYESLKQTSEEAVKWKQLVLIVEEWRKQDVNFQSLNRDKDRLVSGDAKKNEKQIVDLDLRIWEVGTGIRKFRNEAIPLCKEILAINVKQAAEADHSADAVSENGARNTWILVILDAILALIIGIYLSRNITIPLKRVVEMLNEFNRGELSTRLAFDRTDEIGQMAKTMDEFAEKLQKFVIGALKSISDGDLSIKIPSQSNRDEIAPVLNKLVENLTALVNETRSLSSAAIAGKLGSRGDTGKFNGGYSEVVKGVNDTLDAVIGPLNVAADYVDKISKGNIPAKITDNYNGDFNVIKNNLNQCIEAVNSLVADANMLAKAAVEGKLATRAEAKNHQGDFRKIVEGVNDTLDSVINPLNVAAEYVDNISKGNIPAKIVDQYKGDFNIIKNNLNQCIDAVNLLVTDANMLAKAAVDGKLATRADANKHQGDFKRIVQGVNDTLDSVIGPLNVAADYVDKISKGDIPSKIIDNYNGDFNVIKNNLNRCIDAVNLLVADANMLAKAAVEGRLATRADASKHWGDFKRIVQGVNDTLDAVIGPINEAAATLERVANRDLSSRMNGNYQGDLARIKDAMNTAVSNLDESLQRVSMTSDSVSDAATQIGSSSQNLAQVASEQASSLEEISATLEEMSAMTKQNSSNADQARQLTQSTVQSAEIGDSSLEKMSVEIGKIKEASDQTAKIVKTIDEIAFQTNLLALNAAVEAARAGEAGKGFAVVAEEVRNLAQRSASAAKNTSDLIEEARKKADSGVAITAEVAVHFKSIVREISRINELVESVSTASKEQTIGIEQVNVAVGQLNALTQQNAANSEESASAAQTLNSQAIEMTAMVNEFELSETRRSSRRETINRKSIASASTASDRRRTMQRELPKTGRLQRPQDVVPLDDDDLKEF